MGNACSNDENREKIKQDEGGELTESKNQFRGTLNREEGELGQSPENEQKQHELNEKYSNNLQPIDELPEITNPQVRMSIDRHGSYAHQSILQESMAEEVDLKQKVKFRFNNSSFDGDVVFPNKEALKLYQEYGQLDVDAIQSAVGTQVFANDARYEGDFQRGKFNGSGRFIHANGDMYEGEFVDNVAQGFGKFKSADESIVYEGFFQNDHPEGQGVRVMNGKEHYAGVFVQGKKNGQGDQHQEGVYFYKGGFKNDTYDGEGEYVYEDGTGRRYKGHWDNGKMHGQGSYTFENGDIYQGEYVHGQKHGHGKLTMNEKGIIYEGGWANGKQHGEGRLYATADLKEIISGTWEMGQFKQNA